MIGQDTVNDTTDTREHRVEIYRFAGSAADGSALLEPCIDTREPGLYLRKRTYGAEVEQCFGRRLCDGAWTPLSRYEALGILGHNI